LLFFYNDVSIYPSLEGVIMFEKKYDIPTICDKYIDLYSSCNIGCEHCKFQLSKSNEIVINKIDLNNYYNSKILVCYSVDPYPYGMTNTKLVRDTINRLHHQNNKIVFLTRRAECLKEDLDIFTPEDLIGISISENCSQNASNIEITKMYQQAKKMGLKTWLSLEPITSFEYANNIINNYQDNIDFIRVGRDDLINYDYEQVKQKIYKLNNSKIFIK
jgi:DNA repair photolyase